MKRIIILTTLTFILVALYSQAHGSTDCGLNDKFRHDIKHYGKRWVYEDDESIFFTAPMSVNTDGAPNSYHPDDPSGSRGFAINTICNGANALLPNGKIINYNQCDKLINSYREAKSSGWNNPKKARMKFYGVAKHDYIPCTIKSGRYKGYFVSTTSQVADKSLGLCDQNRYLNALELPFAIYPGHNNFKTRGVGKKDIAIFFNPNNDILEYAIIGDKGPKWGLAEGSVYLAKILNKKTNNPRSRKDTYNYAVSKVHVLILSKVTIEPPYTLDKIRKEGKEAFKNWGGRKRFDKCVVQNGSRE